MKVGTSDGFWVITPGAPCPLSLSTPPAPGQLARVGDALAVGTFHPRATVTVVWSSPAPEEPPVMDGAWDSVAQTVLDAEARLQVHSPDGSAPHDDEPWLTQRPGRFGVRVYARREGFLDDDLGPAEDVFIELWDAP